MTNVLTVRTAYSDLAELASGLAPRVDEERIMLYGATPQPDGAWVRFVVMLLDGTTALEGVGRCVASLDNGPAEAPEERFDIVLEALQLEGRDGVMFERIMMARQSAERGDPPTGEMAVPQIDKLEQATLAAKGNWADDGDETEVGHETIVDTHDIERLPSELPPSMDARPPVPPPMRGGPPPMPVRRADAPASRPPPGAPTPAVAPTAAPPPAPSSPSPTPGTPPVAARPAQPRPALGAPRPSPGLPPRPGAPPRPDGAQRKVAPAPRPAMPMPKASRPDLASPSKPPAPSRSGLPARPSPDAAIVAELTREASGTSDAFDLDIKTLENRPAEDEMGTTIEIRDEDKTQQVDLTEMARRSMVDEGTPDFTSETTLPEGKPPGDGDGDGEE